MLDRVCDPMPSNETPAPILRVEALRKYFTSGPFHKRVVKAVDGLSLEIQRGEALALVGETGSGKTTVGRCIARLCLPSGGGIYFKGREVWQAPSCRKTLRREMQIIFQDPDRSLDPRMRLFDTLAEPLKVHGMAKGRLTEAVEALMERVSLSPDLMARYPHELSGGQRQRIGIARAFSLDPELIIADEAGASLDLLAQAQILELMKERQKQNGTAYLFISHNLNAVRRFADRIAVIYLGRCVETGRTRDIFNAPAHPYTRELLSAFTGIIPLPPKNARVLEGAVDGRMGSPDGCGFHPRCPEAHEICSRLAPRKRLIGEDHSVWCHF